MDAKKWYLSKTFWFNVVAVIVMVLGAFGYTGEVPEEWGIYVPVIISVVNLVLRAFYTKQPLGK